MGNSQELQQRIERLRHITFFKDIKDDQDALAKVASLFETISHPKGHVVLREGDEGDELFVIKEGKVRIDKKTIQGDDYTVTELSAEDNVFFGEVALLDPDTRSATVTCQTNCVLLRLSRDAFTRLGDSDSEVGLSITRELSRIICRRLRKANSDIITLFDALVVEMEESGGLTEQ